MADGQDNSPRPKTVIELTQDYVIYLTVVNHMERLSTESSFRCSILLADDLGPRLPGPAGPHVAAQPGIQDNSFLVEEAYNQNFGVVQHISSFTRFFDSKDWNYTFTQEWPVPGVNATSSATRCRLCIREVFPVPELVSETSF